MLWVYIARMIHSIVKFFSMPDLSQLAYLDPNQKCPVCGHSNGKLQAALNGPNNVQCKHVCFVCGASWFEAPLVKMPAVIPTSTPVNQAWVTSTPTSTTRHM